jgi:Raf kinase inhibitor-like YbhB/YbcL family protein
MKNNVMSLMGLGSFVLIFVFSGCADRGDVVASSGTFQLVSKDFVEGHTIPAQFTCDGANVSPQLSWNNAPHGTKSFALICDDPDAPHGTFVHWVIFNIPATSSELAQAVPVDQHLSFGAQQGVNHAGKVGYYGPCPPAGNPHHYHFKLYALDALLSLPSEIEKEQLVAAMAGHIVATSELIGLYERVN